MPPTSANPATTPGDRRPLKSRSWPVMHRLAARLARLGVSANAISLTGMFAAVVAGAALFGTTHVGSEWAVRGLLILAAAGVQLRLLCNLIDGLVAVEHGRGSPVGELYNEVPDRLSDAAVFIGAGYAALSWPELGYLAALLAIMTAYIRAVGKGAGTGSDFGGPMDKSRRMAAVTVAALYLAFAPAGWWPVVMLGDRPAGLWAITLAVVILGSAITCILRLRRIAAKLGAPAT